MPAPTNPERGSWASDYIDNAAEDPGIAACLAEMLYPNSTNHLQAALQQAEGDPHKAYEYIGLTVEYFRDREAQVAALERRLVGGPEDQISDNELKQPKAARNGLRSIFVRYNLANTKGKLGIIGAAAAFTVAGRSLFDAFISGKSAPLSEVGVFTLSTVVGFGCLKLFLDNS